MVNAGAAVLTIEDGPGRLHRQQTIPYRLPVIPTGLVCLLGGRTLGDYADRGVLTILAVMDTDKASSSLQTILH